MLGVLNKEQIEDLLSTQTIGRIGCNSDGKSYVVPVTFAYDGRYIYCHSREGKKIQVMRRNPDVCFEVDQMTNMANWQSVIIHGKYEELAGTEAEKGLKVLVNRLMPLMTSATSLSANDDELIHNQDNLSDGEVVFRIRLDEKTGRFEKR